MQKGKCKTHGEVTLHIVCKHINEGTAENIHVFKTGDAVCFDCFPNISKLESDDLAAVCHGCLRDFAKELLRQAKSENEITEIVRGLEHLKDKTSHKGTG